jgi:hypothetical protein
MQLQSPQEIAGFLSAKKIRDMFFLPAPVTSESVVDG